MKEWSTRQSPFSMNVWVYCENCKGTAKDILARVERNKSSTVGMTTDDDWEKQWQEILDRAERHTTYW